MAAAIWAGPAVLALAYVGLGLVLLATQRRLIYAHHRYAITQLEDRAAKLGLEIWRVNDADYYGVLEENGPDKADLEVLVFHGNAGSALDRTYYISQLAGLGCKVVLLEYPGYGARPGSPNQSDIVRAGVEAVQAACKRFGRPPVILGESLGAAVAAAVAGSGQVPVEAVILITPWDSLPDLAQRLYWYFPAKWFVLDKYDNIAALKAFSGRAAVVLAERDQIVPAGCTLRLFESLDCHKRIWRLPGVGHNDWPSAVEPQWWQDVLGFVHQQQVHEPEPTRFSATR